MHPSATMVFSNLHDNKNLHKNIAIDPSSSLKRNGRSRGTEIQRNIIEDIKKNRSYAVKRITTNGSVQDQWQRRRNTKDHFRIQIHIDESKKLRF